MVKVFQVYNKRSDCWVKMKKLANGKTQILNVKQKNPKKPFVGVPKK